MIEISRNTMKNLLHNTALLMLTALLLHAQPPAGAPARNQTQPKAAVPVEPIPAFVDAFRSRSIVALGNVEFRGNEQSHTFQLSLIRDPRFTAVVNDLAVEFGTARYQ